MAPPRGGYPIPSAKRQGYHIWAVVSAKRARLDRARASRDPVIHGRRECTNRFDYWIPALPRRAKPGSLGRNDKQRCCGMTRSPVVGAKRDNPALKRGGRRGLPQTPFVAHPPAPNHIRARRLVG